MRIGGDRLVSLAGLIAARGMRYSVVKTGEARHLVVRVGQGEPKLALIAHYDRIPGTPGALDNSCACLQLVEFAARRSSMGAREPRAAGDLAPSLLIVFTDAEEAPGSGTATGQGSYGLARTLKAASRKAGTMPAIVLDVTGRGERLLLSTSPAELLERTSQRPSAADGHKSLVRLAKRAAERAGLAAPFDASLPWSDDLGLTLGGISALTISLLPETEARMLVEGRRPPLWDVLHTKADSPELAQEGSFSVISALLDAIASDLALSPESSLY